MLRRFAVIKPVKIPNGLNDDYSFLRQDMTAQLFRGAAVRRAGIVCAIVSACVFLTIGAESGINRYRGRFYRYCMKTMRFGKYQKL